MANAPSLMGCWSPSLAASMTAFKMAPFPSPSSSFRIARFNSPMLNVQASAQHPNTDMDRKSEEFKFSVSVLRRRRSVSPGAANAMACLPESHDERIHVVLRDRERLSGATGGRTQRLDRHVIQGMLFSDELVGHSGCVNRLAWDNDDGTILASVSDDLRIHLWPFRFDGLDPPAEAGQPYCVETLHTQNIFGVGFLPRSDASLLVTGRCVCALFVIAFGVLAFGVQPFWSPCSLWLYGLSTFLLSLFKLTNWDVVRSAAWMVRCSCIDWSAVLCTIHRGIGGAWVCGRLRTGSGRQRWAGCLSRRRSRWARIRRRLRAT